MNAYEVYRTYKALRLHFTTDKYDFFRYKGAVKAPMHSYENLQENEKRLFSRVSSLKEPKTFLVGNFIFGNENYIRYFSDQPYLEYRKYLTSGQYFLERDIKLLKSPFSSNFIVEDDSHTPYILKLLNSDQITLYTACAFQKILNWTEKNKDNFLIDSTIKRINKTYQFFKVDESHLKKMVIEKYQSKDKSVRYTE